MDGKEASDSTYEWQAGGHGFSRAEKATKSLGL